MNSFLTRFAFFMPILSLLFPSVNGWAAKDAGAIVKDGERRLRGESTQMVIRMNIERPDYTRNLKIRSWTLGNSHALVEILQPAKEEGVVSLRVENQMWNYLPKTDQVVRIPGSLMLQSWMGSDFTNDDLMKMSSLANDYEHQFVRSETVQGENTHLISCLPKPGAPVIWGKILHWARVSDNLPVKQEYYDDKGALIRTVFHESFQKMDDRVIPTKVTVRLNDNSKQFTTLTYEKALYDRKISTALFSREELKHTSQKGKNLQSGWITEPLVKNAD